MRFSTVSKERRPDPSCLCCSGRSVHCLYEAELLERHPVPGHPERDHVDPEGQEVSSEVTGSVCELPDA